MNSIQRTLATLLLNMATSAFQAALASGRFKLSIGVPVLTITADVGPLV
jgi:hypothetical protein